MHDFDGGSEPQPTTGHRGSVLFIPDGMRRYGQKQGMPLEVAYRYGADQLFELGCLLLKSFHTVGLFPLARYNLEHPIDALRPLLEAGCRALGDMMDQPDHPPVYVIGSSETLVRAHPPFARILGRCTVNPHLTEEPCSFDGALIVYLAYDGRGYLDELVGPTRTLRHDLAPQWDLVYRTGCPDGLARLSENFVGLEHARLAAHTDLFLDHSAATYVDRLEALSPLQKRSERRAA